MYLPSAIAGTPVIARPGSMSGLGVDVFAPVGASVPWYSRGMGDAYVGGVSPVFLPQENPAPMTPEQVCEAAVPWYCGTWGMPGLINILTPGAGKCAEAWDIYDACKTGRYHAPLPGPGAGPAPSVAVTDPTNVEEIRKQQDASDAANWDVWIELNREAVGPGEPPVPEKDFCGTRMINGVSNCVVYGAIAVALLVLIKR